MPTVAKMIAATRRCDRDDGAVDVPRMSVCLGLVAVMWTTDIQRFPC
jgi:hypothetical protein